MIRLISKQNELWVSRPLTKQSQNFLSYTKLNAAASLRLWEKNVIEWLVDQAQCSESVINHFFCECKPHFPSQLIIRVGTMWLLQILC